MSKKLPKLIVLVGPTASGKTDLAIKLAKKFSGEIVNADSRNIYRGMFIGTASPFESRNNPPPLRGGGRRGINIKNAYWKIRGVRHYLFHYVEPWESYSVGRYKQDAITIINEIISRGKTPILVGGTGLYIWAVIDNLEIPEVPPNPKLREQLMKPSFVLRLRQKLGFDNKYGHRLSSPKHPRVLRAQNSGLNISNLLWDTLIRLDPEAAEFVQKDNPRRVIRALEVILWANKSPKRVLRLRRRFGLKDKAIIGFSDLRQKGAPRYNVLQIGIKATLPKLDKRIDARVNKQIKQGLVQETRRCHSHILKNVRMNPHPSSPSLRGRSKEGERIWQLPSMTSLGYRQIGMFLRGHEADRRLSPKRVLRLRRRFGLDKKATEKPISLEEAIRILKRDTRRYARRQMTWFRRDKRIKWLENKEKIEQAVDSFLKKK